MVSVGLSCSLFCWIIMFIVVLDYHVHCCIGYSLLYWIILLIVVLDYHVHYYVKSSCSLLC